MREILFRGKRVIDGKWVESCCPLGEMHSGTVTYDFISETVCQYTGLTDKNGRKIFEGDIITYQHDNDDCPFPNKDTKRRVGRVYFQEFRSCFAVAEGRNGSDMINQDLFKYVQNGNRVQVIGNIFDNPELIGGQP